MKSILLSIFVAVMLLVIFIFTSAQPESVKKNFKVADFHGIKSSSGINVIITSAVSEVVVSTNGADIDKLDVAVKDGCLVLK